MEHVTSESITDYVMTHVRLPQATVCPTMYRLATTKASLYKIDTGSMIFETSRKQDATEYMMTDSSDRIESKNESSVTRST